MKILEVMRLRKKKTGWSRIMRAIVAFLMSAAVMSAFFLRSGFVGYVATAAVSILIAIIAWASGKNKYQSTEISDEKENEANANVSGTKRTSERLGAKTGASPVKKEQRSYGEKVDPILKESETALKEMGRLYSTIKDPDIRSKINEIMLVTDKIAKDAIEDPSDVPQIRKFFRYYLPTTIKLLHAYDRMSSQEIKGENIDKSIDNINEMLDVAIDAYKKRLDSLFENQALDIETDIDVMNQMLAREGLAGGDDFHVKQAAGAAVQQSSAVAAQQKG